jgi:putative membrane protein
MMFNPQYFGRLNEFWWIGMALKMVFWVVVVALVIWFMRSNRKNHMQMRGACCSEIEAPAKALDILKERLAKGEISTEEYDKLKQALKD